MTQVATPVSVVTTVHEGVSHGTTVSAFMSLSMRPPMALVSLDAGSRLLAVLELGSTIGLNVLAATQDPLARHFATKNEDKFAGVEWELSSGAPRLPHTHAWIAGSVSQIIPAGDHSLILVNVEASEPGQGSPLTYWRGGFGTHVAS
ncbi:flavin reductase family protein [Oerskovia enterophila]|uniref:flavin reductase family protein n=1 Tax=Oerskovia enterophila TaxID=43678 RepID=UPI0037F54E2B